MLLGYISCDRKVHDRGASTEEHAQGLLLYLSETSTKQLVPSAHGIRKHVRDKTSLDIPLTAS
jgi:hypothetical protein